MVCINFPPMGFHEADTNRSLHILILGLLTISSRLNTHKPLHMMLCATTVKGDLI